MRVVHAHTGDEPRTPLTDSPGRSIVWNGPRKGHHAETCATLRAGRKIDPEVTGRPEIPSPRRSAASRHLKEEIRHAVP